MKHRPQLSSTKLETLIEQQESALEKTRLILRVANEVENWTTICNVWRPDENGKYIKDEKTYEAIEAIMEMVEHIAHHGSIQGALTCPIITQANIGLDSVTVTRSKPKRSERPKMLPSQRN